GTFRRQISHIRQPVQEEDGLVAEPCHFTVPTCVPASTAGDKRSNQHRASICPRPRSTGNAVEHAGAHRRDIAHSSLVLPFARGRRLRQASPSANVSCFNGPGMKKPEERILYGGKRADGSRPFWRTPSIWATAEGKPSISVAIADLNILDEV